MPEQVWRLRGKDQLGNSTQNRFSNPPVDKDKPFRTERLVDRLPIL